MDNEPTPPPSNLRRFVVCYTRIPTNFNPTHRAIVDAETPEMARNLVREKLGDWQNELPNYQVNVGEPYVPPASSGAIVTMTGG